MYPRNPSFRFSFRGNIRQNHPFGKPRFCQPFLTLRVATPSGHPVKHRLNTGMVLESVVFCGAAVGCDSLYCLFCALSLWEGKKYTPKVFSVLKTQVPEQARKEVWCISTSLFSREKKGKIHIHQRTFKVFFLWGWPPILRQTSISEHSLYCFLEKAQAR